MSRKGDYGAYRIIEQRMLRRVCANAQTHQSILCSRIPSMDVDEDWEQYFRHLVLLDTSAWMLKGGYCACAISTKNLNCWHWELFFYA